MWSLDGAWPVLPWGFLLESPALPGLKQGIGSQASRGAPSAGLVEGDVHVGIKIKAD